jgi:serine protease AprX
LPADAHVAGVVVPDTSVRVAGAGYTRRSSQPVQVAAVNPGGLTGEGARIALLDTGVADVPGLAGRVVHGPDLSGDGDGVDRYGHGTFMAGLIAGDGTGVAPGAQILSIKLAGADGVTHLSDLLEGMQWVREHRDDEHIDVVNLSFGVVTPRGGKGDPLVRAAEALVDDGLTVVAASGNEGEGVVTSPGSSWAAITVGASDTHGTVDIGDDTVAPWSGRGKVGPFDKPDLVAPGVDVVSLRAPGSTVDNDFPTARIGEDRFRGSGTSMATAIVSGAAAAVLAAHPGATPSDVKNALIDSADTITDAVTLDLAGAVTTTPAGLVHGRGGSASGTGWQGARWAGARWAGARWAGARWAGARWADEGWAGARWAGARWAAAIW